MLVLSRKKNETIIIDGGIEVEILQTKGGTVKVGIKAPSDVRIIRGELEVYPDLVPVAEDAHSNVRNTKAPNGNVTSGNVEDVPQHFAANLEDHEATQLTPFRSEFESIETHPRNTQNKSHRESEIPATLSMNEHSRSPLGSRITGRFRSQVAK